jgi:outer membrane protein assembly factor BamB
MDQAATPHVSDYATAATPDERHTALPRVWPAVLIVAAFWAWRWYLGVSDQTLLHLFLGILAGTSLLALVFLVWWSLDRRGRRRQRLVPILAFVCLGVIAGFVSRKTLGPMSLFLVAVPWVFTAWALWALVSRRFDPATRRTGLLVAIALAWGVCSLLRMNGLSGQGKMEVSWRWSQTAEDRYLAARTSVKKAQPSSSTMPVAARVEDWSEFRGPARDGVVRGVRIGTDWNANPPRLVWRDRVGPGWSSIIVVGNRLYTQEQRGEAEAVVCRDAASGQEIWAHEDPQRFAEAVSGAGPRATPTFANGRIYTMGAAGRVNCLDAATGERKWSADAANDVGMKAHIWGMSGSPLVTRGLVIVYAGGGGDNALLAYNADSGQAAWRSRAGKISYSSPQLATLGGEELVLMWSDAGLTAHDPATGTIRFDGVGVGNEKTTRCVQPRVLGASQVLLGSEGDLGVSLVDLPRDGGTWRPQPRWSFPAFRGMFNDVVVVGDYIYGLDGGGAACIGLNDGKRRWRKGRYGTGQVLLLADQSLMLILSDSGEVALVVAKPDGYQELGRFQAIEGKTWNHPTIVHGRLYVRNGEEIACYELPPAK